MQSKRSLSYFTLSFILLLPVTGLAGTMEDLVAAALARNPDLKSARLQWEAMQEKPAIAGSLPDPMLTYGYFFQNVETRVGAQNQKIGLSQKIPFPGKLSDAKRRASKEALVTMWEYQRRIRDVILRTRLLYYDLYLIDRSVGILREQAGLLEDVAQSSQQTFEAGRTELQDVLKSKLARDDIQVRLLTLNQQRAGVVARLNALRAQPPKTPVPAVTKISLPALPAEPALYSIAARYRQELQQAGVAIERDEIALALARKERLPDFTFGVDYTQVNDNIFADPVDNGHDAVLGFVSINVPIWFGKLNAQERMARKNLEASRESAANVFVQTQADVRDAWFQAQTYTEQIALYRRSLIPQAEKTYEASQNSYTAAKASLIELLDSERSLLAVRLGLVMNEAQLGRALAGLERAVGVDLSDIQSESQGIKKGTNHDK